MITSLVLSAAGLHGLMYVGAVRLLEERGVTAGVRNIYGCSSGGIVALLFALGFTADEMEEEFRYIFCECGLPSLCIQELRGLWERCGLIDEAFVTGLVRHAVAKKYPGTLDMDFLTLSKLTGRNLVLVTSNITKSCEEVLSVDTTPDLSLAKAIHMTACLPVVLQPVTHKGCMYLDGGIWNYLPTSHVNDPDHAVLVLTCGPLAVRPAGGVKHTLGTIISALIANFILPRYRTSKERFSRVCELVSESDHRIIDYHVKLRRGSTAMPVERIEGLFREGHEQATRFWDGVYEVFD